MNKSIRHILGIIRNYLVKFFNLLPLKNIILFESNPDFNDEAYWICKHLIAMGVTKKYQVYWIVKDRELNAFPQEWSGIVNVVYQYPKTITSFIKKYYVIHTSKIILDSCLFISKCRKAQRRLFLHHGSMFMKDTTDYICKIGSYDYFSCGSHHFEKAYSRLGIPHDKMVFLGNGRNDQIANKKLIYPTLLGNDHVYKKVFIWMPTYRQHIFAKDIPSMTTNTMGYTGMPVLKNKEDFERINVVLSELDYLLLVKVHQSQDLSFLNVDNYSNIKVIENKDLVRTNSQLYELLGNADSLITDYSSVYYDYLLVERPIALTIDDLEEYKRDVGFVFENYFDEIKGEYLKTVDDFERFIRNINSIDTNVIINCKYSYHDVTDFTSCQKICSFIYENFISNNI